MKYPRILSAFASTPWALQPEKLAAMLDLLVFQARGGKFSADEIAARISDTRSREIARSAGSVAVLPVYGLLAQRMDMMMEISGGTSTDSLGAQVNALVADEAVKAIILDIDSPGGSVYGMQEIAQAIFDARGAKPIVAQVNPLAASGAYWLASQADEIVATPSGEAGSIGVYTVHDDVSRMLEEDGITRTLISDGQNKAETASFQPLSDDARGHLESRVRDYGDQFRADVARGRGVSAKAVRERFGDGRVFGARDLIERGMVDRIAPLAETISRFAGGGTPARRQGTAAVRAAFAAGALPLPKDFEAFLREAGAPKAQAKALTSHGLPYLARCEAEEKSAVNDDALRAVLATPFGQLTH